METYKIDRSKWRVGEGISYKVGNPLNTHGKGETCLLNKEGYMCCLGFISEQLGEIKKDLLGIKEPGHPIVYKEDNCIAKKIQSPSCKKTSNTFTFTKLAGEAMLINDDPNLSRKQREIDLTNLFLNESIKLEFINKYEKDTQE